MNELAALVSSSTRGGCGDIRDGRRGSRGRGDSRGHGEIDGCGNLGEGSSMVSCFYYKKLIHIKKYYPKLIGKNIVIIISICTCYDK